MRAAGDGVTQLLQRFSDGDARAADELVPFLYKDLRRLASYYLRQERGGHTLQPTALVHEAYLRLMDQKDVRWQNRDHFFAVAAQIMRRILVDYARRHQAIKRGGAMVKIPIEETFLLSQQAPGAMLALDETLTRLAGIDARQARVVELRVFGGLTVEEMAHLLDTSAATVKRDWSMAKAWLSREMARSTSGGAGEVEPD
jgi:RNA polymerase sigma-70 factor, ECF subfamily